MNHDSETDHVMIEFDNVTKVYGDGTEAVTDVSFSVPTGETITLVGPSGCGKTTTMKMINGLIESTSGEIRVDGERIQAVDPVDLRRSIGYIIQDVGLFNHMTIAENIGIVPDVIGWDEDDIEDRVDELIELVRLDADVRTDYPHELSGGQKQRVGVARALAAEPDVMLMDEPFGALDPITREELQDEFLGIQEGLDVTIVFVTHDIREALKMGDHVAVMRDGELVQMDTPADLLRDPANDFVESFLGDDRRLKQLKLLTVGDIMGPKVDIESTSVSVNEDLQAGVQSWLVASTDTIPVVDDEGTVVGSLSRDHIRQALGSEPRQVETHD